MTQHAASAAEILRYIPFLDQVHRAAGDRRVYLVGGAVRDAMLGLPTTDLDFVVREPHDVASRLARLIKGSLVPLHEEFPTARVVARHRASRIDLDLAAPRARSLRADLAARDLTINALAVGPLGPHPRLFDPCGGRRDIGRRLIRMTSAESLMRDPVRVLRAYRFAAQLGFRIDPPTRRQCRTLASTISESAAERVGAEMLTMCAGQHYPAAFDTAFSDGVLVVLVPELGRGVGVEQLGVPEFDVATHTVAAAKNLGRVMDEAPMLFPDHATEISEYLSFSERRAGLVLATLLHDISKPECRIWEGQRWRFFGHEERGAAVADEVTRRLRLPRRVRQQVKLLVGSHMRLIPYIRTDEPTERAKRRLVRDTAPHTIGLVLLCMADWRALRADQQVHDEEAALNGLRRVLAVAREMATEDKAAEPLLSGRDLMALGLQPGPVFGEILDAVDEEWATGNLNTKSEALEWVRSRWLPADKQ